MKKGLEYAVSGEKRVLDLAVAGLLIPGSHLGGLIVNRLIARDDLDLATLFKQERIGQYHDRFHIEKFRTINPDTGEPIADWARLMRRFGLDELAQTANIKRGEMSLAGFRPLQLSDYDAVQNEAGIPSDLRLRWNEFVIGYTKPGAISSYAIHHKLHPEIDPNETEMRFEMDLKDLKDGSMIYDIGLMMQFAHMAVAGQVQKEL